MNIIIERTYHPQGTNGTVYIEGQATPLCYSIELPWQNNEPQISCIPEGTYPVEKRYSQKFKWHLHLKDVPGRALILIHPANKALKELRGCIAPVTKITGIGQGILSRRAGNLLVEKVEEAIQKNETLFITLRPLPAAAG